MCSSIFRSIYAVRVQLCLYCVSRGPPRLILMFQFASTKRGEGRVAMLTAFYWGGGWTILYVRIQFTSHRNFWSWSSDGARHQDRQTDWLIVSRKVTLTLTLTLYLFHCSISSAALWAPPVLCGTEPLGVTTALDMLSRLGFETWNICYTIQHSQKLLFSKHCLYLHSQDNKLFVNNSNNIHSPTG
jgi:hypothetical protein